MDLREHLNADSKGPRDFKKGERCLGESTQVCTEEKEEKEGNSIRTT